MPSRHQGTGSPRFIYGTAPGTWIQHDPTEQRYPAPPIIGIPPGPGGVVNAGEQVSHDQHYHPTGAATS